MLEPRPWHTSSNASPVVSWIQPHAAVANELSPPAIARAARMPASAVVPTHSVSAPTSSLWHAPPPSTVRVSGGVSVAGGDAGGDGGCGADDHGGGNAGVNAAGHVGDGAGDNIGAGGGA